MRPRTDIGGPKRKELKAVNGEPNFDNFYNERDEPDKRSQELALGVKNE